MQIHKRTEESWRGVVMSDTSRQNDFPRVIPKRLKMWINLLNVRDEICKRASSKVRFRGRCGSSNTMQIYPPQSFMQMTSSISRSLNSAMLNNSSFIIFHSAQFFISSRRRSFNWFSAGTSFWHRRWVLRQGCEADQNEVHSIRPQTKRPHLLKASFNWKFRPICGRRKSFVCRLSRWQSISAGQEDRWPSHFAQLDSIIRAATDGNAIP